MNGHYPGYSMKKIGDQVFYYCKCSPNISWNDLKFYDLHYELNHSKLLKHRLQYGNRFNKRESD